MYLAAYACIAECSGTGWSVIGILQNEYVEKASSSFQDNPLLARDKQRLFSPGRFVWWIWHGRNSSPPSQVPRQVVDQEHSLLCSYPRPLPVLPPAVPADGRMLWGAIGTFTPVIGFKHEWEFFMFSAWNFMTGAWGSYNM